MSAATLVPIDSPNDFASFDELKAKYIEVDGIIRDKSYAWVGGLAQEFDAAIYPHLLTMKELLSQRGQYYDPSNDLPGWGEYFENYKATLGLDLSFRESR